MATYSNIIMFVALGVVICLGQIGALTEQEVGVDGMRCDSCGMECSNMCGSRSFRICCMNYVKKRSGGDAGVEIEGGQRGGRQTKGGDRSGGIPLGKFRRIIGGDGGSSGGFLQDPQWILYSPPVAASVRQGHEEEEGVVRQVYSRIL